MSLLVVAEELTLCSGMGASPYSMMGADPSALLLDSAESAHSFDRTVTMAAVGGMYPGYGGMNPMLGGINPMIGAYSPLALQSTYMNNPLLAAQMANISAMGGLGMPAMGLGMNPMMMAGGLGGLGMSPLLAARASPLAYGYAGLWGFGFDCRRRLRRNLRYSGLANPMLNPLAADVVTSRLVGGVF